MGTPDFAVASLDALVKAGANIVGVITAPDKQAGRGMKLTESAVKKYAVTHNLHLLQPEKLKDEAFIHDLHALRADLQVVVAFRMLPETVWSMPPLGTVNLHGSLLPQYRGAAPINWAVINGDTETGVTTFQLQHAIDTGNMLMQEKMSIGDKDNAGDVHDRMMRLGAEVLVKTVQAIAENDTHSIPQPENGALRPAPKIHTETCRINWDQPVGKVYDLIRGLSPYPGAFTTVNGKMLKIFEGEKEYIIPAETPGSIVSDQKSYIKFACRDGYLHATEIQPEGKKRMTADAYLRGHKI